MTFEGRVGEAKATPLVHDDGARFEAPRRYLDVVSRGRNAGYLVECEPIGHHVFPTRIDKIGGAARIIGQQSGRRDNGSHAPWWTWDRRSWKWRT